MLNLKNKNELELQQQDHEILEAIYDHKRTLREYATAYALTYEEAETRLADALRRKKTALTFAPDKYSPPPESNRDIHQGFRKILRTQRVTTDLLFAEAFIDFDDLDAWMEIE